LVGRHFGIFSRALRSFLGNTLVFFGALKLVFRAFAALDFLALAGLDQSAGAGVDLVGRKLAQDGS
jgi:hypothetical protein